MWRYAACRVALGMEKKAAAADKPRDLRFGASTKSGLEETSCQIKTDFHPALCGCCRRCRSWDSCWSINQWFNMCKTTCFYPPRIFFRISSGVWIALVWLLRQPGILGIKGASFVDMYRTENVLKNPICKRDWRPVLWLQYNIYFLFHVWLMESRNHPPEVGKKMEMDDVGQPGRSCKVNYI